MKSKKLEIVRGSGNVFRDLEHKHADADQCTPSASGLSVGFRPGPLSAVNSSGWLTTPLAEAAQSFARPIRSRVE